MSDSVPAVKVCVLGGGNFGTVIANVIAENGYRPYLWMRRQEQVDAIKSCGQNEQYLPGINLHGDIQLTAHLQQAVDDAQLIFLAVPSKSVRAVARELRPLLRADCIIASTVKGIEAESFKLISQVLSEELTEQHIAAVSGPNIAREIAQRQFSATVVAHADQDICDRVAQVLHNSYLRVYSNPDVYGVQLAGALKNIYAIMVGFVEALGLGDNTKSMLMTRALAEMSRFAVELGANPMTFIGLAGVGDLLVTCMSPISRNFRVGFAVGQGKTLQRVIDELGQVAEGVNTLKLVKIKADELNVYMPLVTAMHGLLFEDKSLADLVKGLMQGDRNSDVGFVTRKII